MCFWNFYSKPFNHRCSKNREKILKYCPKHLYKYLRDISGHIVSVARTRDLSSNQQLWALDFGDLELQKRDFGVDTYLWIWGLIVSVIFQIKVLAIVHTVGSGNDFQIVLVILNQTFVLLQ